MRKFSLFTFLSLLALAAVAAKPTTNQPEQPLRALWVDPLIGATACNRFILLESGRTFFVTQRKVATTSPDTSAALSLTINFATVGEAEDWLIELFIRINGLDLTLADVPVDGTGNRNCWPGLNLQLIP